MWECDIKCDEILKGSAWEAVGASPSCTQCLGDHVVPWSVYWLLFMLVVWPHERFPLFLPHLELCYCPSGTRACPGASPPGGQETSCSQHFPQCQVLVTPAETGKNFNLPVTSVSYSSQRQHENNFREQFTLWALSMICPLRRKHINFLKIITNKKNTLPLVLFTYMGTDV